ncbi:transmembrane protein 192-like [Tachypleus tridentatus]|uniref:transmembrane protein 192-like n=1 Tax=Tachypleus tridentatus TaxID=6853 RepID=UPI003FD055CC
MVSVAQHLSEIAAASDSDEVPVLSTSQEPPDHAPHQAYSILITILQLLSVVALVAMSFFLPGICTSEDLCGVEPYFLLIYCHVVLWFFCFLGDLYLQYYHNVLYCFGHIHFYQATKFLRRIVVYVYSAGNSVLLVVVTVVQDKCPNLSNCIMFLSLKPIHFIQILVSIEAVVASVCLVQYLVITLKFLKGTKASDIQQQESLLSSLQFEESPSEVGYINWDYKEDLVQKQADLICYLQQHRAELKQQMVKLKERLES